MLGRRRRDGLPGGVEARARTRGRRPCRPGRRAARPDSRARLKRSTILAHRDIPRRATNEMPEQDEERDREQHHGDRGGAGHVVALDLAEDEHRGDLGLVRQVARRSARSSRTRPPRAPNASPTPARIAGRSFGRMIRRKIVHGLAPSDAAASSMSRSSAISTGCTARTTNGSVTNSSASSNRDARVGDVDPDRAARPVEREQHEAGDDRRQRERQVDQRVDDATCRGSRRAPAPRRSACP